MMEEIGDCTSRLKIPDLPLKSRWVVQQTWRERRENIPYILGLKNDRRMDNG